MADKATADALAEASKKVFDAEAYAAELEKDLAATKAKLDAAEKASKGKPVAPRALKLVRMVVTTGATIADGRVQTEGYEFDADEKDVAGLIPQGFAVLKR